MIRELRSRPATRAATLETRIRDLEQQLARVPARWAGGGASITWIRIDGGQKLNATPEVLGIKGAAIPTTVPATLDPGAVDSAGVETTAPTGTFPDGTGYGTVYGSDGTVLGRRLLRLEGTTVLAGWTFYAEGSISIDDDASDSKNFLVVNNA